MRFGISASEDTQMELFCRKGYLLGRIKIRKYTPVSKRKWQYRVLVNYWITGTFRGISN